MDGMGPNRGLIRRGREWRAEYLKRTFVPALKAKQGYLD